MGKTGYNELASATIQDNREIVISEYMDGSFTLAQRINVDEGGRVTKVYMKNSMHIPDLKALENLRDAIENAIAEILINQ